MKLTKRKRWILAVLASVAVLCTVAYPYARIWNLGWIARLSNRGALGCGIGTVTLHTSTGPLQIGAGLDPINVFGNNIHVSELVDLVERRARCRGKGISPTAMKLGSLYYVILSTLGQSQDQTVIEPISRLLEDPDEVIRDHAALALIRLGEENEDFRNEIASLDFPQKSLWRIRSSIGGRPSWFTAEEE